MRTGPICCSCALDLDRKRTGMATRDHSPIGHLLRRLRTAAALSQEALAERAGLSVRAVSDLERGVHRAPRLETVGMLADALNAGEADRTALLIAARSEQSSTMAVQG